MSGDKETTSEQLSLIHEGVNYDDFYPSGREPMEELTWSLEKESSAYSPTKEKEEYEGEGEGDEEEEKEGEGEGEEKGNGDEGGDYNKGDGVVGQADDGGHKPFILSLIWTVNDFHSTMSLKVFNTLRNRHQIPEHIPLQLPRKFEKCYLGRIVDVNMCSMLRLPLINLHCQLANNLGLFVNQLSPNAWRILIIFRVF